jgi:hypothetical protein
MTTNICNITRAVLHDLKLLLLLPPIDHHLLKTQRVSSPKQQQQQQQPLPQFPDDQELRCIAPCNPHLQQTTNKADSHMHCKKVCTVQSCGRKRCLSFSFSLSPSLSLSQFLDGFRVKKIPTTIPSHVIGVPLPRHFSLVAFPTFLDLVKDMLQLF